MVDLETELDSPVITRGDEVRPVTSMIVVHKVDSLFVCFKTEVWDRIAQRPHFDCVVQTGRSKSLGVFGVDSEGHDVVSVPFKDL